MEGEFLVLAVDFDGTSVGVSMFITERMQSDASPIPAVAWGQASLNLYTWVYDYTIKNMHSFLANPTGYRNVLYETTALLHRCPVPPDDARHVIRAMSMPLEDMIVIRYIASHGIQYSVCDLLQHGNPDAFSMKLSDSCTLIVSRNAETEQQDQLRLILLYLDPLEQSSVVVMDRVKALIEAARLDFRRDTLWATLLSQYIPSVTIQEPVRVEDFEECLRLSHCIRLDELEPGIEALLASPVVWLEFDDG